MFLNNPDMNAVSFLAVIPARGGSKRTPNKNIRPLHGKPLVSWSIEAALESKFIDRIVVSSDDDSVLGIAAEYGRRVDAIKRPAYLSSDTAKTPDVVIHAIDSLQQPYDAVILLQPTSPFRTALHIDEAVAQYVQKGADGIISVTKATISPLWCNILPEDGDMSDFLDRRLIETRSQDFPVYHTLNGAIFIANTKKFREQGHFYLSERIYAYVMSTAASLDIDTEEDFAYAEFLCTQNIDVRVP